MIWDGVVKVSAGSSFTHTIPYPRGGGKLTGSHEAKISFGGWRGSPRDKFSANSASSISPRKVTSHVNLQQEEKTG